MKRSVVATSIAVLVALCVCFSILPATASAHVDKKHRVDYLKVMMAWDKSSTEFKRSVKVLFDTASATATEMQPLLGSTNPTDQMVLKQLEDEMASLDQQVAHGSVLKAMYNVINEAADFYERAAPWFKTHADKIELHTGSTKFHNGVHGLAVMLLQDLTAVRYLAIGNVAKARDDLANAEGQAARNAQLVETGLEKLTSLE